MTGLHDLSAIRTSIRTSKRGEDGAPCRVSLFVMISDEMLSGLVTAYNGTVEIVQRDRVGPQRSSERKPIEKSWRLADAKAELMRRYGIAEPVAHTMLQRLAMECRMPL